jgi:hypothetical protein
MSGEGAVFFMYIFNLFQFLTAINMLMFDL